MTPALHVYVCPSCEAGYHGEHSDAVAFGLLQCDCHCHFTKCVPGRARDVRALRFDGRPR